MDVSATFIPFHQTLEQYISLVGLYCRHHNTSMWLTIELRSTGMTIVTASNTEQPCATHPIPQSRGIGSPAAMPKKTHVKRSLHRTSWSIGLSENNGPRAMGALTSIA
jgi:hypothetical protein